MYPAEILGPDDDDGTMPQNVENLKDLVVGHRIVDVERKGSKTFITLDNGDRVSLVDTSDCCAYTELNAFLLNAENIDHVITGVGTTGDYTNWHIYADMGEVLELMVSWSCGNPFYYGYGFHIQVEDGNDWFE